MKTTAIAPLALVQRGRTVQCARLTLVCALLIATFGPSATAGVTDLSNQPLATRPNVQAKPNLLFILDNSGSMGSAYMPDDMSGTSTYGYYSAQCNGVAYDPTLTYVPPLNADGTSFPNASFIAAKDDGFSSSSTTTNLSNSNNYYYVYNGNNGTKQPKMGWTYDTNGPLNTPFYQECTTSSGSSSSVFTKVTVASTATEAQNYANWYSYYRKRYLLMRTAMGRAISALDSSYRVGFSTISDKSAVDGTNNFRDVKDFDATQKTNFYSSLYAASPSGNTPLRGALSKAGRYYAKKVSGQTYDPVQYSCQRNYALLSTDGYWNTGLESTNSPKFGPYQLDNATLVGNQDGAEVRPMLDETVNILTKVTTYSSPATRSQISNKQSRTIDWTKVTSATSTGPGTQNNGGTSTTSCTKKGYYLSTVKQRTATETQTQQFTTPQVGTSSYTSTVVTTNGVVTSTSQTTPTIANWANDPNNPATVAITDTNGAGTTSPTITDPIEPPASAYSAETTTLSCDKNPSLPSVGSTHVDGSWSPTLTYTYTTAQVSSVVTTSTTQTPSTSGGASNTLADVAEYYYATDLRDSTLNNCTSGSSGENVCSDIVRPAAGDNNTKQHMNTFTIGLGVSGTLPYDRNYLTQTSGAFADLKSGALNWPAPSETSNGGNATNVDDLWHAAVNGRGQYYSALNAGLLADAINGVINSVQQVAGSASAASTSSLELVAGNNNQVYGASYTTVSWTGDLQAFPLSATDATITPTATWSAQAKLDALGVSSRKIYFSGIGGLQSFAYGNLSTAQKTFFDNLCSQTVVASQCATLSTTDKTTANSGANLINYLKGDRTYESAVATASTGISATTSALYRKRDHVLGDIINGAPVHVGKPPFKYGDAGYADFVTAQSTRTNVVYVAANDGMLHAFQADATASGGTELWAYVPTAVLPNLYKLADSNYANKHQYFADGAPVMGDIKVGNNWKTILVAGLNSGGSSYYALDITDPNNPVALWEFTDANMGLTYGNPIITKRADGTWVVAFTSGYNNTSGDGQGHLYVLNAATGAKLFDISTGVGSSSDPSGLAKINAWIDNTSDNTAKRYYGGDLKGNLWRFDIDKLVAPNQAAQQLAKFQVNTTTPQPITTKPELAQVSGKPVVVVGTGRYLGVTDISDTTQQSIYAVKDPLTATSWGDVRADTADFVQQTFTLNGTAAAAVSASVSNTTVDWTAKGGWWVDMPHSGERVVTNMGLQFNSLVVSSAIPTGDACSSGGSSWLYFLNVTNGGVITTNPVGQQFSPNALVVGLSWVKDTNGNVRVIVQGSDGSIAVKTPPNKPSSGTGSAHRTSWRELSD
ncbi:pilus assembly protein [Variovorax sp. YR216]|uniref:pilus assembly protein n=1 Tax=Variovorax sp. YR216 TaxID=1882828 RepID=UPI00089B387D|nr:PilC/PilY family type IV pilus protein [Variovorax sp. YR216]SEB12142.1 type IV pilus assembly protein PilY1 [Variovorax sp. YR216]